MNMTAADFASGVPRLPSGPREYQQRIGTTVQNALVSQQIARLATGERGIPEPPFDVIRGHPGDRARAESAAAVEQNQVALVGALFNHGTKALLGSEIWERSVYQ